MTIYTVASAARRTLPVACALLLFLQATAAQSVPTLLHVDRLQPALADGVWAASLLLDPLLDAQGSPRTGQVLLQLPTGDVVAHFIEVRPDGTGGSVWTGYLANEDESLVVATRDRDQSSLFVRGSGGSYQVVPVDGGHRIRDLDRSRDVDFSPPPRPAAPPPAARIASALDVQGPLDLLVVYTPQARDGAGGSAYIQRHIAVVVAEMNEALENSGSSRYVRLVAAREVNYRESGLTALDLDRLYRPGDGLLDEVQAWRSEVGADLVSLMTETGRGAIGIAYILTQTAPGQDALGFSVTVRRYANDFTLAHELGHNLGLDHDEANTTGSRVFPYARGYQDPGHLRDVMAYPCTYPVDCPQGPYFSSPLKAVNGRPTGIAGVADAAKAIGETFDTVVNYRVRVVPLSLPPVLTAVSPGRATTAGGATVALTGTGFRTGASVLFGGGEAVPVTLISDTTVTVVVPPRAVGPIEVTYVGPDGRRSRLANGLVFEQAPVPTLSSVSPSAGPADGGTPLTVRGSHFTPGTKVVVAGRVADDIQVVDSTTIHARAPRHAAGAADVVVTTPGAPADARLSHGYTYLGVDPEKYSTTRVYRASNTGGSSGLPRLTSDGRFLAFSELRTPYDPRNPDFPLADCFVVELDANITDLVSVGTDGTSANGPCRELSISEDGRMVAFASTATNLVSGDTNGVEDVFVRDRLTRTTVRVSVKADFSQLAARSFAPMISGDGRFVSFRTWATHIDKFTYRSGVFVRDLLSGSLERLNVAHGGNASFGLGFSGAPLSRDGRIAAWTTADPDLLPSPDRPVDDVFVRDRQTGLNYLVSRNSRGEPANGHSSSNAAGVALSADGQVVAFVSEATNLGEEADTNGHADVFVHDRRTGRTSRVSIGSDGAQADNFSWSVGLSADGRFVVFDGASDNIDGPTDGMTTFVHDRLFGTTEVVSVSDTGHRFGGYLANPPSISADGSKVATVHRATGAMIRLKRSLVDGDGDGLSDTWERAFGLDATSGLGNAGASGDADGDGVTNLDAFHNGRHPRRFFTRYFAEGATSEFFTTKIALANSDRKRPAHVQLTFATVTGTQVPHLVRLEPLSRATIDVGALPGLGRSEFSTTVDSDVPIAAERVMSWDGTGYGSHAETAIGAPRTSWYLAEGATHSGFQTFYLLQNANTEPVEALITYLRPYPAAPVTRAHTIPARSRYNIWVNHDAPELAATDVSAVIEASAPIAVERAMYLNGPRVFQAGHASAAIAAPATRWMLAEGATGSYFDLFVLVANPTAVDAEVKATFLLPSGEPLVKTYTVGARSRFNIWVDQEDPRLSDTAVSTIIESTNGVPLVVERAMWWPGPTAATWAEGHNSPGATLGAVNWATAGGSSGGVNASETYLLLANTDDRPGLARVTLLFEDGPPIERTFELGSSSRFNVNVQAHFPEAAHRNFGALVESVGEAPVNLVVEQAIYSGPAGEAWAAGSIALAAPVEPPRNLPPTASLATSTSGGPGPLTVTLTASAVDHDGDSLTFTWDFGDGASSIGGATVSHQYQKPGTYRPRVHISDGIATSVAATTVIVTQSGAGAPDVRVTADRTYGIAPLTSTFVLRTSSVGLTHRWDFGDGQDFAGATPAPHTYAQPGSYLVRVVTSDGVSESEVSLRVTVLAAGSGTLSLELFRQAPGDRATPAGRLEQAAFVRVNGAPAGWTDAEGRGVFPVPDGPVSVRASIPSFVVGQRDVVMAGGNVAISLVLEDDRDVVEPTALELEQVSNGLLAATTGAISFRFADAGATVPLARLYLVQFLDPDGGAPVDVTDQFVLDGTGRVVPRNIAAARAVFAGRSERGEIAMEVVATDANEASHVGVVRFHLGRTRIVGTLRPPSTAAALPLAGVVVEATVLGTAIKLQAKTDGAGTFLFDAVPATTLSLSTEVVQSGLFYYGDAVIVADVPKVVAITLRTTDLIVGGGSGFQVETLTGLVPEAQAAPADPALLERRRAEAALSSTSVVRAEPNDILLASVVAQGGVEGVPIVRARDVVVPRGVSRLVLTYRVRTAEWPNYCPLRDNRFDDVWAVEVAMAGGRRLFRTTRNVNSQVQSEPAWRTDGTSPEQVVEIDLGTATLFDSASVSLIATATNFGDSGLPTVVEASLSFETGFKITSLTPRPFTPTKGASDHFSIPRNGRGNANRRELIVALSNPELAKLSRAKVLMTIGGVEHVVYDGLVADAPQAGTAYTLSATASTVIVPASIHAPSASPFADEPPSDAEITFSVHLEANVAGHAVSSFASSRAFNSLWQMPQSLTKRYSDRDAPGLDDWSSPGAYHWLATHAAAGAEDLRINDVSGEHGLDLKHATHYRGTDIDVFHIDGLGVTNNGTAAYERLVATVLKALGGEATCTQLCRELASTTVSAWLSNTRDGLESLASLPAVAQLIYGDGLKQGKGAVALKPGWMKALLLEGKIAGFSTVFGPQWAKPGSLTFLPDHYHHIHIDLDDSKLSQ